MQSLTNLSLHPCSSASHGVWVKLLTFQSLSFRFCKIRIIMPASESCYNEYSFKCWEVHNECLVLAVGVIVIIINVIITSTHC